VEVQSSHVISKVEGSSANLVSGVENKAAAGVETLKEAKANTQTELRSDVKAVKESASSVKPVSSATVSAETKTETKATINKH
jgi:hypothetical protein